MVNEAVIATGQVYQQFLIAALPFQHGYHFEEQIPVVSNQNKDIHHL